MREIASIFGLPDKPIEIDIPKNLVSAPAVVLPIGPILNLLPQNITTMSRYSADFPFSVAFPPQAMTNVLAEALGNHNLTQAHVAETEKYAHVTFFFNGGVEKQFPGEDRFLVPSPKVATYDLDPKMSAHGVAEKVAELLKEGKYDFVMCNFAPPDMVRAILTCSLQKS